MSANAFRWMLVSIAVIVALVALTPTFLDFADGEYDGDISEEYSNPAVDAILTQVDPINLGLDLQGGLLLQYHVLVDKAVQDKLDRMAGDLQERLEEKGAKGVAVTHTYGEMSINAKFAQAADTATIDEDLMTFYQQMNKIESSDTDIILAMDEAYIEETKDYAITQAIERIRQRVDALGVAEPSITRQGLGDIVVQLPGLEEKDIDRAKKMIGATAQLEFRMVDDAGTNAFFNRFSGKLPKGFQLRNVGGNRSVTHRDKAMLQLFFKGKTADDHFVGYEYNPVYKDDLKTIIDSEKSYWKTYYLFRKVELTGDYIQDARVSVDPQFNRPYVALNFDSKGADLFGDLSANNVGKRMAIMLDDEVQSAPVFNEAIPGGRAQINMSSTQSRQDILQQSENLVISLRHGALPAPIEKQFETVVGPTLGQDSIDKSKFAFSIGMLLVVLFMMFYYRFSGVISVVALTLNMIFILSGLGAIGATLTLPGIAGIILTIGMAVDANVIIFERIREEKRDGKKPREAMLVGFEKALSAVIDANVTTGIAGLVLLQFGTGPIKGFAVTLLIGIISTIFTAVFISRMLFETSIARTNNEKLSI